MTQPLFFRDEHGDLTIQQCESAFPVTSKVKMNDEEGIVEGHGWSYSPGGSRRWGVVLVCFNHGTRIEAIWPYFLKAVL